MWPSRASGDILQAGVSTPAMRGPRREEPMRPSRANGDILQAGVSTPAVGELIASRFPSRRSVDFSHEIAYILLM
jgi:hypothetical protein